MKREYEETEYLGDNYFNLILKIDDFEIELYFEKNKKTHKLFAFDTLEGVYHDLSSFAFGLTEVYLIDIIPEIQNLLEINEGYEFYANFLTSIHVDLDLTYFSHENDLAGIQQWKHEKGFRPIKTQSFLQILESWLCFMKICKYMI